MLSFRQNARWLVLTSGIGLLAAALGLQPERSEAQPIPKKADVFQGKFGSVRGAWFEGEHKQRGTTLVVDDKTTHVLYFRPEKRNERLQEALKLEGAMALVTGRLLSPEDAAKIHDVASGKDRRILQVDDIRFGENIDPLRAVRVPVVLRVKWLRGGAAKAIAMEDVELLAVLKNTSGEVFQKTFQVGRANVKQGADLPQEACTIYLEPSEDARKNRFWTLLDLNLDQKGVSHVAR